MTTSVLDVPPAPGERAGAGDRPDQAILRMRAAAEILGDLKRHVPEVDVFDMSVFCIKNHCGTTACAAGSLGLHPWFRVRNFKTDRVIGRVEIAGVGSLSLLAEFFGLPQGGDRHLFFDGDVTDPREIARRFAALAADLSLSAE